MRTFTLQFMLLAAIALFGVKSFGSELGTSEIGTFTAEQMGFDEKIIASIIENLERATEGLGSFCLDPQERTADLLHGMDYLDKALHLYLAGENKKQYVDADGLIEVDALLAKQAEFIGLFWTNRLRRLINKIYENLDEDSEDATFRGNIVLEEELDRAEMKLISWFAAARLSDC